MFLAGPTFFHFCRWSVDKASCPPSLTQETMKRSREDTTSNKVNAGLTSSKSQLPTETAGHHSGRPSGDTIAKFRGIFTIHDFITKAIKQEKVSLQNSITNTYSPSLMTLLKMNLQTLMMNGWTTCAAREFK